MSTTKILLAVLFVAGGAALGYGFARTSETQTAATHETTPPPAGQTVERKILYWYDPMSPNTRFDKPGKSPFMDMDLVPRYADDAADGAGIRIDPTQVQNLGLRTAPVVLDTLSFAQDIPANITFNDYQRAVVQSRAEGFVEKTYSVAVGDHIVQGTPLVDITVPGWASDQSEYLLLKSNRADERILRGVREKLRLSGMPDEMLQEVEKTGKVQTRLTLTAPVGGIITSLEAYKGMNVDKSLTIATIRGIDPVWVTANVPESALHLVDGQRRIRVSVPAFPDIGFQADSHILLPEADAATRTVPLRLSLKNADQRLKPGMTAFIRLRGTGEKALLIPSQALIDMGDEQRVIVRSPDGRFIPKAVTVLRESREKTAIGSGLSEGDEVVVSGLFMIDSEANLRGALDRMRQADAPAAPSPEVSPPGDGSASGHTGQH